MLTEREKELLAVVRYYNKEKPKVSRLVKKLTTAFDDETASSMTGFNLQEIAELSSSVPIRRLGPSKKTQKVIDQNKAEALAVDLFPPEPLFDTLTIVGRVANDAHEEIKKNYKSGDWFMSQTEFMQKLEVTHATTRRVMDLLLEKNILIKNKNPRKPHVVK